MPKKKIKYIAEVDCPHCGKRLVVREETEIITPAEPAEKEVRYFAEKSTQTTL